MKTLIKKIKNWIQIKIDKYVIKRFQILMPKTLIKSLYRMIVEDELQITTIVIDVKKGKIKYTLIIVEDRNGKTRFNLGRHFKNLLNE